MNNITLTMEQALMKIGELTMLSDTQRYTIQRQGERIRELEEKYEPKPKDGGKKK